MTGSTLACRPVELDMSDEFDRLAAEMTFVYDGSIEHTCAACLRRVWVGPRQQVALTLGAIVNCFRCAVEEHGVDNIVNLGNPQPNPKRRA